MQNKSYDNFYLRLFVCPTLFSYTVLSNYITMFVFKETAISQCAMALSSANFLSLDPFVVSVYLLLSRDFISHPIEHSASPHASSASIGELAATLMRHFVDKISNRNFRLCSTQSRSCSH